MEATQLGSFYKQSCVKGSDEALYDEEGERGRARYAPVTCKVDHEGQIFRNILENNSKHLQSITYI